MSRTLAARGKKGAMELQHCDACRLAIYPRREICPSCLSADLSWRPVDGAGEVLAGSILSHSFDADIVSKLPLPIVSVKLDIGSGAGPVVIAYATGEDIGAGDRVCLEVDEAAVGGPALRAKRIDRESQE